MKIRSKRSSGSRRGCRLIHVLILGLCALGLVYISLLWNFVVVVMATGQSSPSSLMGKINNNNNKNNNKSNKEHANDNAAVTTTTTTTITGNSRATPVYATPIQWRSTKSSQQDIVVDALYAFPTGNNNNNNIKGIVLLLHACTHNMYKFFSPSPQSCPQCVGLSEELHISRLCLSKGYAVLAISSTSSNGCWNESIDIPRLRMALSEFQKTIKVIRRRLQDGDNNSHNNNDLPVIAIGASSGGTMAAKLLVSKQQHQQQETTSTTSTSTMMAQASLVMVMGLGKPLVEKIINLQQQQQQQQTPRPPLLFLAPMPKDIRTTRVARDNALQFQQSNGVDNNNNNNNNKKKNNVIILDDTTCDSFPLTESYLLERVPDMTPIAARTIVTALSETGHLHSETFEFVKDPTKSNWRDVLLKVPFLQLLSQQQQPPPKNNDNNNKKNHDRAAANNNNELQSLLWGTFVLTPGQSPLAKAFHRAWAFHEYCSEVVIPALEFFEERLL